jgi:hypothetical protein
LNHAAPPLEAPEPAIPYAPPRKSTTDAADGVENAGQTIVELLNQAVEAADANIKHALDVAQKLSRQLRVAEERIIDLEADLKYYKDRAERAEKWLNFISSEIEHKFFGRPTAGPTNKS